METSFNPKLLDVVSFISGPATYTGTIVDIFGADIALVEVSDESGIAKELKSISIEDLEVIGSSSENPAPDQSNKEAHQYFGEGIFLLQNGILPSAKERFERAFALEPKLAVTLMNLTNELAEKKSFDSALALYRLIMQLQPDYQPARENLARTYLNRGVEHAHAGSLDKALEDFTNALSFSGSEEIARLARHNLAAAHTQIGLQHIPIRRFSEALQFFLVSFQLYPSKVTRKNFALALVSLLAWKQEGRYVSLDQETFKEPMLIGLTYSECLNAYGATMATFGKITEAREILEHAIAIDPSNHLAKRNLGVLQSGEVGNTVLPDMWGIVPVEPQSAHLGA